jgi:S-adenosyl-L-methionine hydrolase (adenosine-forming)
MAARRSSRRRSASAEAKPPPSPAPLITLTTDFGVRDPFVGIMKGVLLGIAPAARIVDLTHAVPPQNVVAGAYLLASAVPWFPRGTIHVAVVDPGVGTRRRALLVETANAFFVGPDNGLLSLAAPARTIRRIIDVSRSRHRLRPVSRTFHGRDVFAPIAAALASGIAPEVVGRMTRSMQRLRIPPVRRRGRALLGEVLWVDGFGNLATNVTATDLAAAAFRGHALSITIEDTVVPFRSSYASVPQSRPLALMNSADLLEIAVNHGSAAEHVGAGVGSQVRVEVA